MSLEQQNDYLAKSRNAWRKQSIQTLLDYLTKYTEDHNDQLPSVITNTTQKISKSGVDLCSIVIPQYDNKLNKDTGTENSELIIDCSTSYDTGFTIIGNSNDLVTITAPFAELGETISQSKQF